jgi:hypothetical protein
VDREVWGDSSKAGELFVFRIHNDPGYIVLPHVHPIDEYSPQGVSDRTGAAVAKAERLMPALIAEMRADLRENPLRREFVVLKKAWSYWGKGNELVYFYDDHEELDSQLQVLASLGLIREITYNKREPLPFRQRLRGVPLDPIVGRLVSVGPHAESPRRTRPMRLGEEPSN